jgi:periplasmic copper chaperone A
MWRKLLLVVMFGMASSSWAGSKDVVVKNAWLRESVPGQTSVSVQLDLTCTTAAGKLVAVDSPVADSGEMQRLWPSNGKVKMVPVKNVRLPHGRPVSFGEHTISLMLLGLKQPLKVGDQVPVNLTVMLSDGNKLTVEAKAEVRPLDLSYKHYQGSEVQDH